MLGIFKWIGSGFVSFGKALVMPFRKVNASSKWRNAIRWTVHFVCLAGVLTGLGFLNYSLGLDTVLRAPATWLRASWLPLLGLQIYALSWIGWWLCRTITTKRRESEHPDLEQTWTRVTNSLEMASIDIRKTPLFLVLGQTATQTAQFFNAGQVPRKIPVTPSESDAAFHLYANDDAVYLCLEETSLLGRQAAMIGKANAESVDSRSRDGGNHSSAQTFPTEPVSTSYDGADIRHDANQFEIATAAMGGEMLPGETTDGHPSPFDIGNGSGGSLAVKSAPVSSTATLPMHAGTSADHIAARSMELIDANLALAQEFDTQQLAAKAAANVYQPAQKVKIPVLQNELEIDTTLSRLGFLCELVHQARHPFCPINGIVVLIPFGATENEVVANHVGMLIEQDLEAVRNATMVEAPRIAVLCDLQQAHGCVDLLSRFPNEQQHRRLGLKFPRVPDCDRRQYHEMVADGLDWLCNKMVPPLVNRLFSADSSEANADSSMGAAVNRRLYQFTQVLRERQNKIERLVRRAFFGNHKREGLLRGLYLSAAGKDSVQEHGFTAGIFAQVDELQNDIGWTTEAVERDREFRRWTVLGYAGVTTMIVTVLACLLL